MGAAVLGKWGEKLEKKENGGGVGAAKGNFLGEEKKEWVGKRKEKENKIKIKNKKGDMRMVAGGEKREEVGG